MGSAMVFRTDRGLTVSLPDDASLPEGEVEARQDGETVVLVPKPFGLRLLETMEQLGELVDLPDDPPPQAREGL